MIKNHALYLVLFITFFSQNLSSQNFWQQLEKKASSYQNNKTLPRKNLPKKYALVSLELQKFENHLINLKSRGNKKIIKLPNESGDLKRFLVKETSYLAPKLAAKYPMIKSYSAQGIDDPTAIAKISLGTNGLHALVSSGNKSTIYIDPYTVNKRQYIVYKRKDLKTDNNNFNCQVEEASKKIVTPSIQKKNADDGKLRTFRIAIACTGEYSQFHLNRQNIPNTATETVKKAAILSAMNTTIARVNEVYERDLAVRMIIVNNNDDLIFLDADTDGLTNNDADFLIDESQQKCDAIIGNANYDIGHTFSTGGGGLAQLASVCITNNKAKGITGSNQPINDPFDIDYVAHEIGHQFGGTHTFNASAGNCSGNIGNTSVEPGSGTTIMAYAGICSPQNVQNRSDDYFHTVSIAQMWAHVNGYGNCATQSNTNNDAPTANAGPNVSIPKGTPFVLKATATDAQGTASLTYNWEQTDAEVATMPPLPTNTVGPTFRSLPSSESPDRYLPTLDDVVNGTSNQWIVLPEVARELNFALTVRDNHAGGGSSARDNMKIFVTDAEPFTITAPNTNVSWGTGSSQTITWNKGTTDQSPINCTKVNIKLSVDGGLTFPITLKQNTDNDGSEDIIIPNNPTTKARIIIEAAGNIFYNVNATNFTIDSTGATFLVSNKTDEQTVCNNTNSSVSYTLNFDFINGFNETVDLTADVGLPNGATVNFSQSSINTSGDVIMTIDDLNGVSQQDYTIVIKGQSPSITQSTTAFLTIKGDTFNQTTLNSPVNNANDISVNPTFTWSEDANATSYNIMLAKDVNFTDIIINETVNVNSYTNSNPLTGITKYFWKVKPINDCGEGTYSTTSEFTTETPSYCTSTFTDEDGGSEHIINVTFNSINNNSNNDTEDGYEDFTNIKTNIKRTEDHQISVTYDTAGYQDQCYVFIDWNQDYQFDIATERYDLGKNTADISNATKNIKVPEDAVLGETRMRVIIEYYSGSSPNGEGACDENHKSEWGETEDYTVIIEEKPQPDFTLTNTSDYLSICNQAIDEQMFSFDYKQLFGFNEDVSFSITGTPANTTNTLNSTIVNTSNSINFTINNLKNANAGDYTMVVTATSNSITKSITILFNISDSICNASGNTVSQISTTLVNFGDINNTSTKTNGYSDFKSITTEVTRSNVYNLIVNANSDGDKTVKTFAWIDWNQDCLFDNSEKYDLGEVTNANEAASNSGLPITIPSDALTGSTTLRIITKLTDDGNPNSCEIDFNGEVEDYTINITPSFSIENTSGNGSICNKATNEFTYLIDYTTLNEFNETVTFTAENVPDNATVNFSPSTLNSNGIVSVTISDLTNVTPNDYIIKLNATSSSDVKSINLNLSVSDTLCKTSGNNESQISITNVSFGEIENASTKTTGYSDFTAIETSVIRGENYDLNITINPDGNSSVKTYAWIDWNQDCLFEGSEKYDLTANNVTISVPDDAIVGATTLRISTKIDEFSNSCELDFNGEVEDYSIIIEESFATQKSLFSDLKLYPVPLSSDEKLTINFKVKTKDLTIVKLFNLSGQLLEVQEFSTVSSQFNQEVEFTKVSSGIYLLHIENDGKIKINKILIK